jgi:hypothetical protein
MHAVKVETKTACQRPGCRRGDTLLCRLDGELFVADRERGVEAGYRLYCSDCATGIVRAADKLGGGDGESL